MWIYTELTDPNYSTGKSDPDPKIWIGSGYEKSLIQIYSCKKKNELLIGSGRKILDLEIILMKLVSQPHGYWNVSAIAAALSQISSSVQQVN